ncbi:UDP-4-amino-4,6-dideoxy-N-acetyl-beta-L-altrosamine transaminase [Pinisolibacter sp. B13]|uniref:UDP-4-amino-4, 6-dideoxy-N-acetyl-beta-L-altrosamine transaminase n=1 Tax=Pinisolibacter aquiterrae TaxID=2815579 RepID=UPI001C3D5681|nr:UDP-4-amino-4,6-dideoxy-N-acetyl-beta-L-altrosamine transaminase [Pinisolibacter aquiterrae]MBV5265070.1 UDP-4-amino-4,6-dideoxy-N-acetyl-beta-L-altrosamine transaminase [Pinisolibacter aquiterrae]
MIPYGRQDITQEDRDAVLAVLDSDFLTQGPALPAFEAAVREVTGAAHAFAVNSATSALHIAYLALDLGPGDVLWTSPNTFLATSNAALFCGASVDFVDIDPDTLNLSVEALAKKLAETRAAGGRLPKIVVPVHFGGEPCDMAAIAALAREYGFAVVEDASHAIGASYGNHRVGACAHSDMTVFSFHPVKIVTTGEGGAVTTNRADLADRLGLLRSHGMTRDERLMRGRSAGGWYYEQVTLGFNYRMTDIQAALGTSQMKRLDDYIAGRETRALLYDEAFAGTDIGTQRRSADARSALHLYVLRWPKDAALSRREAYDRMRAADIGVNLHYIPVYLQPYYADLGFRPGLCPAAEAYHDQAITIPLHPRLTRNDQDYVIETVRKLAKSNS